jgi:hypothetical protein
VDGRQLGRRHSLRHVDAQFPGVDQRQQPRQLVGVAVDEQVQ